MTAKIKCSMCGCDNLPLTAGNYFCPHCVQRIEVAWKNSGWVNENGFEKYIFIDGFVAGYHALFGLNEMPKGEPNGN